MEQGQDKKVRFREVEQSKKTRAQSTEEQDATSGLEEEVEGRVMRASRGSAGLVRGRREASDGRDQQKRQRIREWR